MLVMLVILFILCFIGFWLVCLIFLVYFSVRLYRYITVGFILGLCYFGLMVFCVWAWIAMLVDLFARVLRLVGCFVNSVGHVHVLVLLLLYFRFVLFLC